MENQFLTIDKKMELAEDYNNPAYSKKDLLNRLLKDEQVRSIPGIIQYIKDIIAKFREYAQLAFWSHVKGYLPFKSAHMGDCDKDGKPYTKEQIAKINEGVDCKYYDYSKTEDCKTAFAGLYKGMDISDDFLNDKTLRDGYQALKKQLGGIEITGYDDKTKSFTFDDPETGHIRYVKSVKDADFIKMEKIEKECNFDNVSDHKNLESQFASKDGYHFVDPKNLAYVYYIESQLNRERDFNRPSPKQEQVKSPVDFVNPFDFGRHDCVSADHITDNKLKTVIMGAIYNNIDIDRLMHYQTVVVPTNNKGSIEINGEKYYQILSESYGNNKPVSFVTFVPEKDVKVEKDGTYTVSVDGSNNYMSCKEDDLSKIVKDGIIENHDEVKQVTGTMFALHSLNPLKSYYIDRDDNIQMPDNKTINQDGLTIKIYGDQAVITDCSSKDFKIPQTVTMTNFGLTEPVDVNVTAIGDNAFAGKDISDNIVIPDYIKNIGESAFEKTQIKNITFEGNTSLSARSFADCPLLSTVDGLNCTIIADEAFDGDVKLKNIDLSGIKDFGVKSFNDTSIPIINLSSAEIIKECAFANTIETDKIIIDASKFDDNNPKLSDDAFFNTTAKVQWDNLSDKQQQRLINNMDQPDMVPPDIDIREPNITYEEYGKNVTHQKDWGIEI